jgi:hypothetical protein
MSETSVPSTRLHDVSSVFTRPVVITALPSLKVTKTVLNCL